MSKVMLAALAALLATGIRGQAQNPPEDHSCTLNAAGQFAIPFGKDGNNFFTGAGFQAGGGFAVTRQAEPGRGASLYITANFLYDRLDATSSALASAKLASASSAHGEFSAATLDPTVRFRLTTRVGLYLVGGFGWFRRGVSFNGANPATLIQSSGSTLDRLAADSGVVDAGGGINIGLTHRGGPMLYVEARVYHGLAVNNGTTLLPVSVGVRW